MVKKKDKFYEQGIESLKKQISSDKHANNKVKESFFNIPKVDINKTSKLSSNSASSSTSKKDNKTDSNINSKTTAKPDNISEYKLNNKETCKVYLTNDTDIILFFILQKIAGYCTSRQKLMDLTGLKEGTLKTALGRLRKKEVFEEDRNIKIGKSWRILLIPKANVQILSDKQNISRATKKLKGINFKNAVVDPLHEIKNKRDKQLIREEPYAKVQK